MMPMIRRIHFLLIATFACMAALAIPDSGLARQQQKKPLADDLTGYVEKGQGYIKKPPCVKTGDSFCGSSFDDGNPCTQDECCKVLGTGQVTKFGEKKGGEPSEYRNGQNGEKWKWIMIQGEKAEYVVSHLPKSCPGGECNQQTGQCETLTDGGCNADDGDPCTKDFCRNGKRVNQPITFDDGNPCTLDKCISTNGIDVHESHKKLSDTPCPDNNACNGTETCQAGVCAPGKPLVCPNKGSPSACKTNSCDPNLGCVSTPWADGTVCGNNDEVACKGGKFSCQAGNCQYTLPPQCDDKNPCTIDTCQPLSGCGHKPAASGTTCDDNNTCTTSDVCSNGSCAGEAKCPKGSACDPATGECKQGGQTEPTPQISKLGVGGKRACWVKTDGSVSCAGNNEIGQSGKEFVTNVCPAQVIGGISNPKSLASAALHNCAILQDGSVVCWGSNKFGQVGIDPPNTEKNPTPTPVMMANGQPLTGAVSLAVGYSHSCAVLQNGQVACWGGNLCGELGDHDTLTTTEETFAGQQVLSNSTPFSSKALLVDSITDAIQVSVGGTDGGKDYANLGFTCALLKTGMIKCWGGQQTSGVGEMAAQFVKSEGNGECFSVANPTNVNGVDKALSVASSDTHSCLIEQGSQKTVKCWGENSAAVHNLGYQHPSETSYEAKPVFSGQVEQLAVGHLYTCARLTDGHVKCWGKNIHGELGVPKSTTSSMTPVFVMDPQNPQNKLTGTKELSIANSTLPTSCVLTNDHQVKCWGDWKPCDQIIVE